MQRTVSVARGAAALRSAAVARTGAPRRSLRPAAPPAGCTPRGAEPVCRMQWHQRRAFSATAALFETVKMAEVGEGIKQVEILVWAVKVGDTVAHGDKLCEVQSDKATVEIPSTVDGKITKLHAGEGDMVQVGAPLLEVEGAGAPAPAAPPAAAPAAPKKKGGGGAKQVLTMNMADVGEGIKEVEVLGWAVQEGDMVEEFQKLCDVQSDKATVEVTSRYGGKLVKIHTPQGSMQQVGQPLVDIETADSGEDAAPAEEEAPQAAAPSSGGGGKPAASAPSSSSGFAQSDAGKKVLCTPKVRKTAREHGIDLSAVPASGQGGRVTMEDIDKYIASGQKGAGAPAAGAPSSAPAGAPPGAGAYSGVPVWSPEDRTVKITGIMKRMVQSMTDTLSIPTFNASDEVDLNKLIACRAWLKPMCEKRGAKLSLLPFFIKASSLALKEYPVINSQLNPEVTEVLYKGAHNIGFAMDTKQGLIVPNIKDVQSKTIFQIAQDLNALQERGATGKLTTADLQGGTFTLSNIGPIGATYVAPIIFAPQVAIGALGRTIKKPRYNEKGEIVPVNTLYVTWTADHRVIDGATMVRFSNLFKSYLENPDTMLLDMA